MKNNIKIVATAILLSILGTSFVEAATLHLLNTTDSPIWVHLKARHKNKSKRTRHNEGTLKLEALGTKNNNGEYTDRRAWNYSTRRVKRGKSLQIMDIYNYDPSKQKPTDGIKTTIPKGDFKKIKKVPSRNGLPSYMTNYIEIFTSDSKRISDKEKFSGYRINTSSHYLPYSNMYALLTMQKAQAMFKVNYNQLPWNIKKSLEQSWYIFNAIEGKLTNGGRNMSDIASERAKMVADEFLTKAYEAQAEPSIAKKLSHILPTPLKSTVIKSYIQAISEGKDEKDAARDAVMKIMEVAGSPTPATNSQTSSPQSILANRSSGRIVATGLVFYDENNTVITRATDLPSYNGSCFGTIKIPTNATTFSIKSSGNIQGATFTILPNTSMEIAYNDPSVKISNEGFLERKNSWLMDRLNPTAVKLCHSQTPGGAPIAVTPVQPAIITPVETVEKEAPTNEDQTTPVYCNFINTLPVPISLTFSDASTAQVPINGTYQLDITNGGKMLIRATDTTNKFQPSSEVFGIWENGLTLTINAMDSIPPKLKISPSWSNVAALPVPKPVYRAVGVATPGQQAQ